MDGEVWNQTLQSLPGAHLLQTWEWGQLKNRYGWQAFPQIWNGADGLPVAAALALTRRLTSFPILSSLKIMYVPRGPVVDWNNATARRQALAGLEDLARKQGAIFIKIDPEIVIPSDEDLVQGDRISSNEICQDLINRGWRLSKEQIQFRNTVLLDLGQDEDALLAQMKPKTRYNIRLAERKGVSVRIAGESDFAEMYRMYAETSVRDGFVIRPESYYLDIWRTFTKAGKAHPLIAEVESSAIAGLVLFTFGQKAWYIHGMSRDYHREKMPNYLLQWKAMLLARQLGCSVYDLWGAPDLLAEEDPMWGVYRFKVGLGGKVSCTPGAWDFPVNQQLYWSYTQILPKILSFMRFRGKARTKQEVVA